MQCYQLKFINILNSSWITLCHPAITHSTSCRCYWNRSQESILWLLKLHPSMAYDQQWRILRQNNKQNRFKTSDKKEINYQVITIACRVNNIALLIFHTLSIFSIIISLTSSYLMPVISYLLQQACSLQHRPFDVEEQMKSHIKTLRTRRLRGPSRQSLVQISYNSCQ